MNGTLRHVLPMENEALTAERGRAPTIVNGTLPPPRRRNEELRPRELLTGGEVERPREAAGDRLGRNPRRDGTMVLLAHRHGPRVPELAGLRRNVFPS